MRLRFAEVRSLLPLILLLFATSCQQGGGDVATDTNLLQNSSFENGEGAIPDGWVIKPYRGLSTQEVSEFTVDDLEAASGSRSFRFAAGPETKTFYSLMQEIEVPGARRLKVNLSAKYVDLKRNTDQFGLSSVALVYYDKDHRRFQSLRVIDARTEEYKGTSDGWFRDERIFALPDGIHFVEVHCLLAKQGTMWFDDISAEVPAELDWKTSETGVFVRHHLEGNEFPEGSDVYQRQVHEEFAKKLGVPPESWQTVHYYYYPDTTSLKATVGGNKPLIVDYKRNEIHSIRPTEDHELVHILMEPYGRLPRVFGEGTAYYCLDKIQGLPVQPQAQQFVLDGRMPPLLSLIGSERMMGFDHMAALVGAASFVGFLIEYGGTERFLALHRQAGENLSAQSFADAFEAAYGGSFQEAEATWRRMLETADFSGVSGGGGR